MKPSRLPAFLFVLLALSCDKRPSDAQLEAWKREADDKNDAAAQAHAAKSSAGKWSITFSGRIKDRSVRLDWARLQELATTHVKTRAPHHSVNPKQVIDWRGIEVRKLLDLLGATDDAQTLTFLGDDLFSATISVRDAKRWPIILAVEQDGAPIKRSEAGPVVLVFPYTEMPEVEKTYDETYWAFYVSHVVVDRDAPRIRVGQRVLDRAALEKLPRTMIEGKVGFRVHWPAERVKVYGPRLRDVLAEAGVAIQDGAKYAVRSKAPALPEDTHEVRVDAADVKGCDVILAMAWGEDKVEIPAPMGGPIGLAFGPECRDKYAKMPWTMYAEDIEVIAP